MLCNVVVHIQNWNSICTKYFAEQLAGVDRCDVYTNVHLWLILRLPNDQEKSFTFGFKLKKTIFVVYFLASIPILFTALLASFEFTLFILSNKSQFCEFSVKSPFDQKYLLSASCTDWVITHWVWYLKKSSI